MFTLLAVFVFCLVAALLIPKTIQQSLVAFGCVLLAELVIGVLVALFYTFVSIPAGMIGVQTSFGEIVGDVLPNGLQCIYPWRDVIEIDPRTQKYQQTITVRSKDSQKVILIVTLNYNINQENIKELVQKIGSDRQDLEDKILVPHIYEVVNQAVATFGIAAIMEKRAEIKDSFVLSLKEKLIKDHIVLSDVNIEEIDFSDSYDVAIQQKNLVGQAIQQLEYELELERNQAKRAEQEGEGAANALREQAKGAAAAKRAEGVAKADSILKQATAEVAGLEAIAKHYDRNLLELDIANKWDGKLPRTSINPNPQTAGNASSVSELLILPTTAQPSKAVAPQQTENDK